jgi:nucleotide-binding universal stress UspA family protein
MFKHILLPTDGSELSDNAARVAVDLARSLGAKITAFNSIAPYQVPVSDGLYVYGELFTPEEYKQATEKAVRAILAKVQAEAKNAGVECDPVFVTAGAPWDAIVKAAAARKCDLIVMASHGRKGVVGVLLGSETTKVLTHSKTPVLVCR